ncbi:hypothetical protein [Thermohalobaculum sediminis]|nr:hypothetical protein [Limibaculum sediminis]
MQFQAILMVLCLALAAGCAPGQSVFEDRSDQVQIKRRVPSK